MKKLLPILIALAAVTGVFAASVTLSTGSACLYSSATTDGQGNMRFTCADAPPPPPAPQPPPPPVAGCKPGPHIPVVMGWTGNYVQQRAASGVVMAFLIPPAKAPKVTVRLMQGQQPASPAGAVTEFTISRCPGVIDPASACYRKSAASNFVVAPDAFTRGIYQFNSQASIGARGCWAPASEGPWYVNVRWTYAACPLSGGCGFSMQWAQGSY